MEFIQETLVRVAEKSGAQLSEQGAWLRLSLHGESEVVWESFLHCAEEERLLLVYLLCPGIVLPDRFPQVIQVIRQINAHLKVGTFVLGEDQGELQFRLSQFLPPTLDGDDADDFVYRILQIATSVADACLPELSSFLTAGEDSDVSD